MSDFEILPEPLVIMFTMPPPVECSPNSRVFWAERKRAVDQWRFVARADINRQIPRGYPLPLVPPVMASTTVSIPRNKWRRQDADNFQARLKPLWDLLVEMGILKDDRQEMFTAYKPAFERFEGERASMVVVLAGASGMKQKGKGEA